MSLWTKRTPVEIGDERQNLVAQPAHELIGQKAFPAENQVFWSDSPRQNRKGLPKNEA
jgi:hypothetical protein